MIEEYGLQQFYKDGGSTEQALFYHNYCAGFLLLAIILRNLREEPVSRPLRDRVEQALEFTMWMTRSDGTVPAPSVSVTFRCGISEIYSRSGQLFSSDKT